MGTPVADYARALIAATSVDGKLAPPPEDVDLSGDGVAVEVVAAPGRPPGLAIWGADDPYVAPAFGKRLAERTGAKYTEFAGCSHWWPLQRPSETAALLEEHWSQAG